MTEILKDLSAEALMRANKANLYASTPFSYNLPQAEVHKGEDICWCITNDMPLAPHNVVFKAHLKPEEVDRTIDFLIEKARRRNVPLRWWLDKDDKPADLGEHLKSHGFTTTRTTPFLAIDLRSMKEDAPLPTNVSIADVTNRSALETWCHIAAVGFGIPPEREPSLSQWFTIALDLGLHMHFYLAFQNGEPVATSQLFLAEGVAGIYYVATLPQARKQGIGYAITLRALQAARDMGYRAGILQPSQMGENIYRRMGFEECGKMTAYQWRL